MIRFGVRWLATALSYQSGSELPHSKAASRCGPLLCYAMFAVAAHASTFQYERTIKPGAAGPNRLDVDVALLSGAAPSLRDLRLYDAENREVGYLLVEPTAKQAQWKTGTILNIAATKTASGIEVDFGEARDVDMIRLEGIAAPFLKRARVEGSGDRARWTLLADTTVFDLPDERLRRLDVAFEPGRYRYVRVAWDDRSSARVTRVGRASARLHGTGAPAMPLRAGLQFRKRSSEPGKSRYTIDLPGPALPIEAIEVEVSSGDVFRGASISEPKLTGAQIEPVPLGSARLRRAERGGAVATEMSIPINARPGREIHLTIDDGSNPPLPITAIVARLAPQPWIYFDSPDNRALTARYGNPKLDAPKYDIEAARTLLGKVTPARASWTSTPSAIPRSAEGTEAAMPQLGAKVDPKQFRFVRALENGKIGLAVVALDADVLSRSRDLADVRIIDRSGRQVPYVVERRDEPLKVDVKVPDRGEHENNVSTYRIALPYDTLPYGTRVVITTSARVFERDVKIVRSADERRGREPSVLAQTTWRNSDPNLDAPPLTFDVPLAGTNQVELEIGEGDNAPLPITSVTLLLPARALRFIHPGTPLVLAYGNRAMSAPRYDLQLLAPRLFNEPAMTIAIAGEPSSRRDDGREGQFFWIVIAVTAAVLLVLLARLLVPLLRETPASE